jgi:hypothetical protein
MPLGRRDQDTPQRAFINATTSGNTAVVVAQGAGVKIRVLSVFAISPTILNVKFQSATTDISATFPLDANGGFVMPSNYDGWFQTNANEALNVNLSGVPVGPGAGVQVTWVPTN